MNLQHLETRLDPSDPCCGHWLQQLPHCFMWWYVVATSGNWPWFVPWDTGKVIYKWDIIGMWWEYDGTNYTGKCNAKIRLTVLTSCLSSSLGPAGGPTRNPKMWCHSKHPDTVAGFLSRYRFCQLFCALYLANAEMRKLGRDSGRIVYMCMYMYTWVLKAGEPKLAMAAGK